MADQSARSRSHSLITPPKPGKPNMPRSASGRWEVKSQKAVASSCASPATINPNSTVCSLPPPSYQQRPLEVDARGALPDNLDDLGAAVSSDAPRRMPPAPALPPRSIPTNPDLNGRCASPLVSAVSEVSEVFGSFSGMGVPR